MAEIENVTGIGVSEGVEDLLRLGGNDFRSGEQDVRIKVALQADLAADAAAGLADIDGPVEADGVTADGGDSFQPQAAILGKHDARHALTVPFLSLIHI